MINFYKKIFFSCCALYAISLHAQDGYGNQLIFGRSNAPSTSTILQFNDGVLEVESVVKNMELEGSCTVMCDSVGKLLFYSNGCYISNADHEMMVNGDSIGKAKLETSYCNTGGNPVIQSIIALPAPNSSHLYYLIYFDLVDAYPSPPYFALVPLTMYYAVIDMSLENGKGAVIEKNTVLLQDTFSRGQVQAQRHVNNKDWWIVMPQSHSNCYWTVLLTEQGIDTVYKQCIGNVWSDRDSGGQSVFAPTGTQYARMTFMNGLEIFDFDPATGMFFNDRHISMGVDTFPFGGLAYAPNSRYLYACCSSRIYQYDTWSADIGGSKLLVATLNTPSTISQIARFDQARLMPDGKIYIAGSFPHKHLHVIHRPNCYGVESNVEQYAVPLYSTNTYTMPNMPHYKKWSSADTCQAVSVFNADDEIHKVVFYPNPASGILNVDGLDYGDQMTWFNIMGREVWRATYNGNTMNISTMPSGIYWVNVSRKHQVLGIFKIVVVKEIDE